MAEPLKNRYGPEIPRQIAAMIRAVRPDFDSAAFLRDALDGYEALELMPRGRHIARALRRHLPDDFAAAADILVRSLGPEYDDTTGGNGMAPFLYLPHSCYIEDYGLDHLAVALDAQHAITRRFTAEFSIRAFLKKHPEATLARLREWAADPNPHVRRLVSEGTRPRLPWACRLPAFQRNPAPVLALLETLKDDPDGYVRRSVANNLNDIGKDHPDLLVATARRWLADASPERTRLVRHALRSLVKAGHPGALAALGYGHTPRVTLGDARVTPKRPAAGDTVVFAVTLHNPTDTPQRVLADLRLHFARAAGKTAAKVFKWKTLELAPGERITLTKAYAFTDKTTRAHHAGRHRAELLLNGQSAPLGEFDYRG